MKRIIVLFTTLLFTMSLAFSASFNLGVVKNKDNNFFTEIVETTEFILKNSIISDSDIISNVVNRDNAERLIQNELSNHNALIKEAKTKEFEETVIPEELEAAVIMIDSNSYLENLDKDALDHALLLNKLDALIVTQISLYNSLTEVEVYYYDGNLTKITHTLLMHGDIIFESYSKGLLNILNLDYGIIKIENSASGLKILNNKEEVALYGNYLLEKAGTVNLSLNAPYYNDRVVEVFVEKGGIVQSDLLLSKKEYSDLILSSIPSKASVSANGAAFIPLPHLFSSLERPSALIVRLDGFETKNIHLNNEESISVNLKPSIIVDDTKVESAKKRMYSSLRNTLFSFGFTVASMSIDQIYQEKIGSALQPITIAFSGVTIVSLLDFIDSVVDYYSAAKERL